ncbi:periplasmic divalent manganese/zinc-binding lipoprotein [Geotalea daltonii FRC-32]|uniref:Periplasmic divalent manganese/zinc-binding lipoprotein n=1 Tax=Geotalea daltonii (strain DSM 22248 / JCM 15807 / FRC-32) TaxID=316067 RepID=B9M7W2_GEODF|nr:zinc ABC transporter substrate-binding protein [Geotalea daltonii]ACM18420.1 periplasmic divalent manganese/zinc-binding lipoprotein [Geotalea daltonii FRC-32]
MKKFLFLFMLLLVPALLSCEKREQHNSGKLKVVTTLFPLFDFARQIGGDKIDVTLLLPPGMEPHSFEPKPDDIIRVSRADIFIFTNRYMEPWAAQIAEAAAQKGLTVDASRGVNLYKAGEEKAEEDGHGHRAGRVDPHVWLDFDNDRIMVDNILAAFVAKDPANRQYYTANAVAYKAKLADLDGRFKVGLSRCATRDFLHGGHFAFGYMARRYNLHYQSAYALNAEAEPTAGKLTSLIRQMRSSGLKYIYTEELLNPRVAETIARETGAQLLRLHGAHNIGKADFDRGVTFISLMEENLKNLRTGLQCP